MVISFLCRPQKAPEKWVSLSPPKQIRTQRLRQTTARCETSSSWPEESPKLPSPRPAHGPGASQGWASILHLLRAQRGLGDGSAMCHCPAAAVQLSLVLQAFVMRPVASSASPGRRLRDIAAKSTQRAAKKGFYSPYAV